MIDSMQIHATCVARENNGVRSALLLTGPSGSGKSDLALRLIGLGFMLVADDRVDVSTDGWASPPNALAGLFEARGLGVVRMPFWDRARIALVIRLESAVARMPTPMSHPDLSIPMLSLDPTHSSAAHKASLALDCALDRNRCHTGAFAA